MRSKEELEQAYNTEMNNFKKMCDEHVIYIKSIADEYKKHAKYMVGQKVKAYPRSVNKPKQPGIIRKVYEKDTYSDKLGIYYEIGKIKKNGFIHHSHNLCYGRIKEEHVEI